MQTHFPGKDVDAGKLSRAYWAIIPERKAVVFVHGFGGTALGTWSEFPKILNLDPRFAATDLIFYGYDGKSIRANNSAKLLGRFLNGLISKPANVVNNSLGFRERPSDFSYDLVVIVGHSLGAVVSRRALIDAHRNQESWILRTRLVLFAPAHCGADIIQLVTRAWMAVPNCMSFLLLKSPVGWALKLFLRVLPEIIKLRYRVLKDLEPDCQSLRKLLADSISALQQNNADYLVASPVFHSDRDDIVEPIDFASDPPYRLIEGKTHTQICKPRSTYPQPIDAVAERL